MSLCVIIMVDRASAILAGKSTYGRVETMVDPAQLAPEQRAALAAFPLHICYAAALDLTRLHTDKSGRTMAYEPLTLTVSPPDLTYPTLAEATPEAVLEVLAAQAEAIRQEGAYQAALKAAVEQRETERRAEAVRVWEERQRAWMAVPDAGLLGPAERGDTTLCTPVPPFGLKDDGYLSEVQARVEALTVEFRARCEARQARREAKRAAEKEAEARRAAQIAALPGPVCSAEQQRRHAAGRLPESEILDAFRALLFKPLDPFPRFARITRDEVYAASEPDALGFLGDEPPKVDYDASTFKEPCTAEEFATYEAIQEAARTMAVGDDGEATVTLREHCGGLREATDYAVFRKAVHVEARVGEVVLSREYACP